VKGLLAAHGREHDRRLPGGAEQLGRRVDAADIDEAARPDLKSGEPGAIRSECRVVIDAGRQAAVMGGRQSLARDRLELEHVQGIIR
jgi:hypothetical protein